MRTIKTIAAQICDVVSLLSDHKQPDIWQAGWAHQQAKNLHKKAA